MKQNYVTVTLCIYRNVFMRLAALLLAVLVSSPATMLITGLIY